MTANLRKALLVAHVTASVGWLGAVVTFLALAATGLASDDGDRTRAAYVAADVVTGWVIVPAAIASLVTGLAQSLVTPWGLFRHYWVVAKLVLTVVATALLWLHTQPIRVAARAAEDGWPGGPLEGLRVQLVADAAVAIAALLLAVVLSVFKPKGLTRRGWRAQYEAGSALE